MNKLLVKVGVVVIAIAAALFGWGLLEKIGYENCMEMIRAFERGESGIIPVCPADHADRFFFAALPASIAGVVILVIGRKNSPLLPSSKPQSG